LTYQCAVCGEVHEGPPPGFGWRVPDLLGEVSPAELEEQHWIVVDELVEGRDDGGNPFFGILGNLELPVRGAAEPFGWTVWASLSEEQAAWALETWFEEDRVQASPAGGYLLNMIPVYPDTHGLQVSVHWQPVGTRPLLRVVDDEHPLAQEQRHGITPSRLNEIVHALRDLGWAA
jgi:hypothetical protein